MKKSLLLVALLVSSCATGPKYTEPSSITPGYGRVSFLRVSGLELLSTDLTIDSVKVVTLSGGETSSVEVKPGSYTICRGQVPEGPLCLKSKLDVVENQSYYVVSESSSLDSALGWIGALVGQVRINYSISLLESAVAKDRLKDYRETPPLISKYPN